MCIFVSEITTRDYLPVRTCGRPSGPDGRKLRCGGAYNYLNTMEIIIILLLILLNGLFAMSEVALISARKSNLNTQAKQEAKRHGKPCCWPRIPTSSSRRCRSASR